MSKRVQVILTRSTHTEWVKEETEEGGTKKVPKIFKVGEQFTVPVATFETFRDRFEVVPPTPEVVPEVVPPTPEAKRVGAKRSAEKRVGTKR